MKLLTVTVPCYNSAAYMRHAVDSMLPGGEEMDILIVDDGSTDETAAIADEYVRRYPDIVRVVHQPNGGHGAGINTGIREALGLYFKVVDSDDRLDPAYLPGLLDVLRGQADREDRLDLIVHDYVDDRPERQAVHRIRYGVVIPERREVSWSQMKRFHSSNQFMIHALVYRTQMLRDMGLKLPEHVFYEDNLYIYRPLPNTRRVYYYPEPLYGYFVGRADQSTNNSVILKRIENVTFIAEQMTCSYHWTEMNALPTVLRDYMVSNACGNLCTASSQQYIVGTEESLRLHRRMWDTIRDFDADLYRVLRRNPLGWAAGLDNAFGRWLMVFCYNAVRWFIKTN